MSPFALLVVQITLIGIGPVCLLRNLWGRSNAAVFILLSTTIGLLLFNLLTLSVGHLGYGVTGQNLASIKIGGYGLSLILTLSSIVRDQRTGLRFSDIVRIPKPDWIDCTFIVFLVAFFGFLLIYNSKFIMVSWDHMSYWLVDAKIIYLTGKLRATEDVINQFIYSSFYPLHAVYLYDMVGDVAEQYATYFTILYAFLGTCFAYLMTRQSTNALRLLALLILALVSLSLRELSLRFYVDVATASVVALFFFCFLAKVEAKHYYQKALLLLLLLLVIAFLKTSNIAYVIILGGMWLYTDRRELMLLLSRETLRCPTFYVLFGLILLSLGSRIFYRSFIFAPTLMLDQIAPHSSNLLSGGGLGFAKVSKYFATLTQNIQSIAESHPVIFIIYVTVVALFLSKNHDRKVMVLGLAALLLPLANISFYILVERYSSIARYVTTIFYCIPALSCYALSTNKRSLTYLFFTFTMIILLVFQAISFTYGYTDLLHLPSHDGRYSSYKSFSETLSIVNGVKVKIGKSPLVVAEELPRTDSPKDTIICNTAFSARVFHYFLIENVSGGTFIAFDETFLPMLKAKEIQNILILKSRKRLAKIFGLPESDELQTLIKIKSWEPLTFEATDLKLK